MGRKGARCRPSFKRPQASQERGSLAPNASWCGHLHCTLAAVAYQVMLIKTSTEFQVQPWTTEGVDTNYTAHVPYLTADCAGKFLDKLRQPIDKAFSIRKLGFVLWWETHEKVKKGA